MQSTTNANKSRMDSPPRSPTGKHNKLNNNDLPLSETDPKAAKQKAAEDKLQLFATIKGIQDGKMPRNAQLDELLSKLISNKVITSREHNMSPDGQLLLKDFRKLLNTVRKSLAAKNQEELFQSLVYHLYRMENPVLKEHVVGHARNTTDKETAKNEGKQAADSMYKIGKLVLLNNEFRSLLGELIDISQDIFVSITSKVGDSLQNAGNSIQSDQNQPDRSGKRLVDNLFDKTLSKDEQLRQQGRHPIHDKNSQSGQFGLHSHNDEEPHLISNPQDAPQRQGLLNTGDSVHPNAIPGSFPSQDKPFDQGVESRIAHNINDSNQNISDLTNDPEINDRANQKAGEYQDKVRNHRFYKNTRDGMMDHKQHARATLKENIPKEKQDELIERLRLVLAQIQKHPDYQGAIDTLFDLIKVWAGRLNTVREGVQTSAKENDTDEQSNYRELAQNEIKALIEGWAQGYSLDPLLRGVQDVMRDVQEDQVLRDYYHEAMRYVDRLLREPGYASLEESTQDGKRLMDQGHHVIKGRYNDHLQYLSTESRKYMNLMAEDQISQELNRRFADIHRDLWMDSEGNPAFKPQLLNDMKMTLLPAFIDEIKYIPIPRVEYSDPQYDIIVENLILTGDTLLPNIFETKIESFSSFSFKNDVESQPSSQSLFIRMSEIQVEIDNVAFSYKKKTGFPKMTDNGVASFSIDRKGISITLRVVTAQNDPTTTFKVAHCKCNVDNLKVKVTDSKHNVFYKAVAPLVAGTIRKQIAKAIEQKITALIQQGDQKITASIVRMHQNLQDKAYEALPENEKVNTKKTHVSQTRPRPSLWSTLLTVANRNIKSKVEKRNEKKRRSASSMSDDSSNFSFQRGGNDLHDRIASPVDDAEGRNDNEFSEPIGHRHNRHHGHDNDSLHQKEAGYSSSNDASLLTNHHNYVSPPHSPTKKFDDSISFKHAQDMANNQTPGYKQDITRAEQDHNPGQFSTQV